MIIIKITKPQWKRSKKKINKYKIDAVSVVEFSQNEM